MKALQKIIVLFIFLSLMMTGKIFAQAPQAIPYQAVARDNNGNLIANQSVSLRFTILNGSISGTVVYQETQITTTNSLGLFNVNVGQGTVVSGTFSTIAWGGGSKFLEVALDAAGGSNYVVMGTSQMMSVPYALNAANGVTGQSVVEVDQTAQLVCNKNITSFVVIPGLTTTITVPSGSNTVEVKTLGGITNNGGANAFVLCDIAIYVDGNNQGTPSYFRQYDSNNSSLGGIPYYYSIFRTFTLSAGSHTVDVRALFNASSSTNGLNALVGNSGGFVGQGELVVTTIMK